MSSEVLELTEILAAEKAGVLGGERRRGEGVGGGGVVVKRA